MKKIKTFNVMSCKKMRCWICRLTTWWEMRSFVSITWLLIEKTCFSVGSVNWWSRSYKYWNRIWISISCFLGIALDGGGGGSCRSLFFCHHKFNGCSIWRWRWCRGGLFRRRCCLDPKLEIFPMFTKWIFNFDYIVNE